MAITNFIVSYILTIEGFNFNDGNSRYSLDLMPVLLNEPAPAAPMDESSIAKTLDYIQSFDLIYQDIYNYTKPALYREYSYNGRNYRSGELNPVANIFFENNLWDLAFFSANAFNYLMFNNKYLSLIYSAALETAEVWAISTWQTTTSRQINVSAILYAHMF